jgi:hypothetical protein
MVKATVVTMQPPGSAWVPEAGEGALPACRASLLEQAQLNAERLGVAPVPAVNERKANDALAPRIIATGHQAQLWHPGILAKDFAAIAAAAQHRAIPLHLVVDQDEHPVFEIDRPRVEAGRVVVDRLSLPQQPHGARRLAGVPTGFQPAVDAQRLSDWLGAAGLSVPDRLDRSETLAEQAAGVVNHWRGEVGAKLPLVFTRDLVESDAFASLLDWLRDDALRAMRAYNRAVYAIPGAGLRPLAISREWVEMPLWACRWERPRQRVYADLADSTPIFVDETGERVAHQRDGVTLMPRALCMTALMRSVFCDLFIHGTGGGVYDQATERWWQAWRGKALAPMSTVSADVYLDLNAPTATADEVEQAVWFAHHLPFNLDRFVEADAALAAEKRKLIEHMDDDRDKRRRARAFRRIHEINRILADRHRERLEQAHEAVDRAKVGRANSELLARRDWCFALYPQEKLASLRKTLTELSDSHANR